MSEGGVSASASFGQIALEPPTQADPP